MQASHQNALDDLLRWRRDVRHFRRDPVDPELLDQLRARMDCAPSVGNSRPWRVLQVEDTDQRRRIVESFETCNRRAAADYAPDARLAYLDLKLAGLREAPVHLAVFTDMAVVEGRGLGHQTMPEVLAYSTVMAIHTLWLAARAENIGLGWVSILNPVEVARILDAPAAWSFTGYLCLGYPEQETDVPLLHEAGWQETRATDWQVV